MAFYVVHRLNWLSNAELFCKQHVGIGFGWICHPRGNGLAAYIAIIYAGNYMMVFISSGVFALVATGLVITIRK